MEVAGDFVDRGVFGGVERKVYELREGPGVYVGAVDPRAAAVAQGDVVRYVSGDVAGCGYVLVRRSSARCAEILVAQRRRIEGGFVFMPCSEAVDPFTTLDPGTRVDVLGSVVEIRRVLA